jgi:rubrerythrin
MDIRKIYEYALARELEGKRFFQENASRLSHSAAVGAFNRLAEEEQRHIEFIQLQISLLDKPEQDASLTPVDPAGAGYFTQRAASESIDQTVYESMVPDLPVLRMAYLIERDFAEFYESSARKAEGQAKIVLESLAAWERNHERFFKHMHDRVLEQYEEMPWGG